MNSERLKEILPSLGRYEEFAISNERKLCDYLGLSDKWEFGYINSISFILYHANSSEEKHIAVRRFIEWIDSLEEDDEI